MLQSYPQMIYISQIFRLGYSCLSLTYAKNQQAVKKKKKKKQCLDEWNMYCILFIVFIFENGIHAYNEKCYITPSSPLQIFCISHMWSLPTLYLFFSFFLSLKFFFHKAINPVTVSCMYSYQLEPEKHRSGHIFSKEYFLRATICCQ